MIYYNDHHSYNSGNLVEVIFVLFSPLFINRKYFFIVSVGMILKFTLIGLTLSQRIVFAPILILVIFSIIAFLLLMRFNSYLEAIKSIFNELHQKEKLAIVGQMAAAIGHEIRNPLASLKGFTQLQQERYPNTNEYYPIMIQEIDRINLIVTDLMYLGKPKTTQFEKENIEEIIAYTLSIMKQQAQRQGVEFKTIMEGPLPQIDCDGNQLKQVFINLVKNAIEAMPNGGRIKIDLKAAKENNLLISIHDEGCGISDGDIQNLGEPFYTNKKDGTGLGLMVTNQIIKDHYGELKFHSRIGIGTEVEVVLPIAQKQHSSIKVS
jgi:signal transduction histidine kinase